MIKGLVALVFLTSAAFAGETNTDKLLAQLDQKAKDLAALDDMKNSFDRMTGAAFQFGWACGQAGNTWVQCQKMFVDAVK
jgi:hypothetical protein